MKYLLKAQKLATSSSGAVSFCRSCEISSGILSSDSFPATPGRLGFLTLGKGQCSVEPCYIRSSGFSSIFSQNSRCLEGICPKNFGMSFFNPSTSCFNNVGATKGGSPPGVSFLKIRKYRNIK